MGSAPARRSTDGNGRRFRSTRNRPPVPERPAGRGRQDPIPRWPRSIRTGSRLSFHLMTTWVELPRLSVRKHPCAGQTVAMAAPKVTVEVDGRKLALSNLDKVLYPESGTAKAEVVDYYTRIAPVLLPHLADRPLTRKRWPDGVAAGSFFEKN